MIKVFVIFVAACSLIIKEHVTAAEPLTTLEGCVLVPTDWADGDSFLIRTAEGKEHTLRLYGADCVEWHVTDDSDARRLREQRRYFGISEVGGSPQASIETAKGFGEEAGLKTRSLLSKPFTVNTAYSNALGDGRYQRFYGFVTTSEGKDLAEELVRLGLARAFGVYRETPTGKSSKESRANLADIELQASKRGVGIWSKTNWDLLPEERRQERVEAEELDIAVARPKLETGEKINPNTAARDQLMLVPGIGEVTANRIIEARPFKKMDDLLEVDGIGSKTFERLKEFLSLP